MILQILRKSCCLPVSLILSCWLAGDAYARMQSESFRLNSSVISGGGTPPANSANFRLNATAGQSSPLMNPDDPPESSSHALKPGFWYTLAATPASCNDAETFAFAFGSLTGNGNYNPACDRDGDGDVDGEDLAVVGGSLSP